MNFTYTAFAKAAKRLAETDDLKLSEAQEKLAKTLGFKNHHAAQVALQAPEVSGASSAGYNGRFWRGLNWMQTFELLTLGGRFETGDSWGLRAMDLMRVVSADIFSKPVDEPVQASEISAGLDIMAVLRRANELREQAKPEDLAKHHSLLAYANSIRTGRSGRSLGDPTVEAMDQHGYLTAQIAPALSALFLLESSNASTSKVLALYKAIKTDPANLLQHIVELESQARFSSASNAPD